MSNDMKQRYDEITSESKKQEEEWNEMYLLIGDLTERQLNILHSVVVNELNWINSEREYSTEQPSAYALQSNTTIWLCFALTLFNLLPP